MNDLRIGPVVVHHRSDGFHMTFYSRESSVDLGAFVVRHTLSPGGGCIKAHLMNAQASTRTTLHESAFYPEASDCGAAELKLDYEAFGRQVLDVCVGLKPGEKVWISTWEHDTELSSQLALQCLKRGCPTLTTVQHDKPWLYTIQEAPAEFAERLSASQAALLRKTDVYIFTLGPRIIPWDKIPPERRKLVTTWFLERNKFVQEWKTIAKARRVRMLGIEATLATLEKAETLGLEYVEWRRIMYSGCMTDYSAVSKRARALERLMHTDDQVHITTPHGTDFTFKLDNRPVDSFDGILGKEWVSQGRPGFLPAGGIEVSADEESGIGKIVFDQPILSLLRDGRIDRLTLSIRSEERRVGKE